jgi:predicted HicB family RNase H-like nuclease
MIKVACTLRCGPYKGYSGQAEYDADAELFHGEIEGTRDVVTFQGKTPAETAAAFRDSVGDYLDFCRTRGEAPDKPMSGKFVVRISPETHKAISAIAASQGASLNQLVAEQLQVLVSQQKPAPTAKKQNPLQNPKSLASAKGKAAKKR